MKRILMVSAALLLAVSFSVHAQEEAGGPPDPTPGATKPVREQNLDGNEWIAVHEQGTAKVEVQGVADVYVTGGEIDAYVTGGQIDANITGGEVEINNTPSNPVPVNVENLPDEQDVYVAAGIMSTPTREYYYTWNLEHRQGDSDADEAGPHWFTGGPILASLIHFSAGEDEVVVTLQTPTGAYITYDNENADNGNHSISLMYPIMIKGIRWIQCFNESEDCNVSIAVFGW
jgi:hypothetical protein